jgi:hypothetical protein
MISCGTVQALGILWFFHSNASPQAAVFSWRESAETEGKLELPFMSIYSACSSFTSSDPVLHHDHGAANPFNVAGRLGSFQLRVDHPIC